MGPINLDVTADAAHLFLCVCLPFLPVLSAHFDHLGGHTGCWHWPLAEREREQRIGENWQTADWPAGREAEKPSLPLIPEVPHLGDWPDGALDWQGTLTDFDGH